MRHLSARELLDVWERGQFARPFERALLLLTAAESENTQAVAALAIGGRNARLLLLRERLFGPRITSVTTCPACGESLELTLDTTELS